MGMLRKFLISSIQRKEGIAKLYSLGGWKNPEKRKEFFYTLEGNDEKTYFYHCYKVPQRFTQGQIVRCWTETRDWEKEEPTTFDICYHHKYKVAIFSDYLFDKAVKDYIERAEKAIEWHKKEIERLKALI